MSRIVKAVYCAAIERESRNHLVVVMLSVLTLLVVSGCAITPQLAVGVDAIDSGRQVQDVRYILKPAVDGVDESDLHFIEYSAHIDNALQKRGMVRAETAEQANVEIAVNYGYQRRQSALVSRYSAFNDPFYYNRRCGHRLSVHCSRGFSSRHYDRFDRFHHRHRRYVDVIESYRVFVTLEARQIGTATDQSALWTTRARANFAKPDLRVTLPLLLVAAQKYIGVDTGQERTVVLSGDDLSIVSSEREE